MFLSDQLVCADLVWIVSEPEEDVVPGVEQHHVVLHQVSLREVDHFLNCGKNNILKMMENQTSRKLSTTDLTQDDMLQH